MKSRYLTLALVLTALPMVAYAQSTAPAGDAAHGERLYAADGCYQCHGRAAQGARPTGPRLARTDLPFDAFAQQLRQPSDLMPPYTRVVMSDKDVADIYAYLKTLPEPPKLADIPILQH
jgi:mono/diheme cytochrome c family protein